MVEGKKINEAKMKEETNTIELDGGRFIVEQNLNDAVFAIEDYFDEAKLGNLERQIVISTLLERISNDKRVVMERASAERIMSDVGIDPATAKKAFDGLKE